MAKFRWADILPYFWTSHNNFQYSRETFMLLFSMLRHVFVEMHMDHRATLLKVIVTWHVLVMHPKYVGDPAETVSTKQVRVSVPCTFVLVCKLASFA